MTPVDDKCCSMVKFSRTHCVSRHVDYARELLAKHFHLYDPRTAQDHMAVEDYVEVLRKVKPEFINSDRSKALLQAMLSEFGCDGQKTYFDLPRLRTSTHSNYLTSGMAYAYHPHRDTWFSAPMCQINWWLPVYDVDEDNCLALHPQYFSREIQNSSGNFDYDDWVNVGRRHAHKHVKHDDRVQPRAEEPLELEPSLRVINGVGGVHLFSAAQLHSSVPNTTNETRLSIDFRTIHLDDIVACRGAVNVDSAATGTNLGDFLRVADLQVVEPAIVGEYRDFSYSRLSVSASE